MMCTIRPGQLIFVLGTAGLAVLSLVYGDFALQWQPVPDWIPGRTGLACVSGVVVLIACAGVFFRRVGLVSACVLMIYQLAWVLTHAGEMLPRPWSVGAWLGLCESFALLIGAWILYVSLLPQRGGPRSGFLASDRSLRAARILFGICCVVFGLSHFAYAEFTAGMIPNWLPGRLALAYLTGACHVAAGIAIATTILARLAATLEALMLSSIVLLVHAPSIGAMPAPEWAPTTRIQWTALCVACALAGSTWLLAELLRTDRLRGQAV
jgi:uncharacterized membrane protein